MSTRKPAQLTPTVRPVASRDQSTADRLRRHAGPIALVAGSALTIGGMALHVEGDGSPADEEFVRTVEAQAMQWLGSHLLLGLGMALVAVGVVTAFRVAHGRGAALTRVGAAVTATGAALMSMGDLGHGVVAYALAGQVDATRSLAIQDAYFSDPVIAIISFGGMLMPVGVVILSIGLLRSRLVPRWVAIVLLASPVVISLGFASGPRMLVFGLPFVVGMTALGRGIART